MKTLRHVVAFVSLASVSTLVACAAGHATSEDGEDVGESKAAIHEGTCGTDTTAHDYTLWPGGIYACGQNVVQGQVTSPDNTYGDSSCKNAFIVQYAYVQAGCRVFVNWAGPALNPSNCSNAVMQIDTYDGSGNWSTTATYTGSWGTIPALGGPGTPGCVWNGPSQEMAMPFGANPRVVASAGFGSCSGKSCTYSSFVPVSVWILTPTC
jgi:hypothetical protein